MNNSVDRINITLFRATTMFYMTDNILQNIYTFRVKVKNILQNTDNPAEHCYGSE